MCICSIVKSEKFFKKLIGSHKPAFKKLIINSQSREIASVVELIINSSFTPLPQHRRVGSYKNKKFIYLFTSKSKLSLKWTRETLIKYHPNVKSIISSIYAQLIESEVIRLQTSEG